MWEDGSIVIVIEPWAVCVPFKSHARPCGLTQLKQPIQSMSIDQNNNNNNNLGLRPTLALQRRSVQGWEGSRIACKDGWQLGEGVRGDYVHMETRTGQKCVFTNTSVETISKT